ncbi:Phosphatidylinositol-4-phosphate 5-kinase 2 [Hordeum vulgare]|nr:Phosphatidylinositol-4-phosphate 5-kinase 2 [Hordeum vulgare]
MLPQAMEWSGSLSRSPGKRASLHAGTGSSARRRRRFAGMDSSDRPPGSALAQRLCGLPRPLIKCDDCPHQVLWLTSGTPTHPGWVFYKCENDGDNGCSFWFSEGQYIDLLIERNLIDVSALLSTIEGNDVAACATRGEATSTSLEPKMRNEESKIKNPQINNECMEKILLQLVRAVIQDLAISFVSNVVAKAKKSIVLDQFKLQI